MENIWFILLSIGGSDIVLGPHSSKQIAEDEKRRIENQTINFGGNQSWFMQILTSEQISKFFKG